MSDFFPQADEGWGTRPFPSMNADTAFSATVAESLIDNGFDLTFCQALEIDHDSSSWLPCLFDAPWPVEFLPIAVNMVMQPVPTPARLHALGTAIRSGIAETADDSRVLFISTGGMSHQIHGSRFGLTNPTFDRYFLGEIAHECDTLLDIPMSRIMEVAGTEAAELAMWYAMRGALSDDIR